MGVVRHGVPLNQRIPASHPDRFAGEPLPRLYGRELARSPSREYVVDVAGDTVVPLESAKGAHRFQWERMHSLAADLLECPLEIWEQEFPCLQGVPPRRERVYLGFLPSGRHYPFVAARTVLSKGHWRFAVFDQVTTAPLWMRRWGTLVYRTP